MNRSHHHHHKGPHASIPPTEHGVWQDVLIEEMRAYREERAFLRLTLVWSAAAAFSALLLLLLGAHVLAIFAVSWIAAYLGSAFLFRRRLAPQRAAEEAAASHDPRAINGLALACRDGDRTTRLVAARALNRQLHRLRTDDAEHITEEGLHALFDLLRSSDTQLTLAILKAFEQIGDSRAIPVVEGLIGARLRSLAPMVTGPNDRWRHVRIAARECLSCLEERAENEKERTTLLRPVESAPKPSDHLLRPASSRDTPPIEQLLRPIGQQEEGSA